MFKIKKVIFAKLLKIIQWKQKQYKPLFTINNGINIIYIHSFIIYEAIIRREINSLVIVSKFMWINSEKNSMMMDFCKSSQNRTVRKDVIYYFIINQLQPCAQDSWKPKVSSTKR